MRKVTFKSSAMLHFNQWAIENDKIHMKILNLIQSCLDEPYAGIGKPEPLKYELKGYWSRRITKEHRLVYKVTDEEIIILSCKFHY
jgi:toxin YoeB